MKQPEPQSEETILVAALCTVFRTGGGRILTGFFPATDAASTTPSVTPFVRRYFLFSSVVVSAPSADFQVN